MMKVKKGKITYSGICRTCETVITEIPLSKVESRETDMIICPVCICYMNVTREQGKTEGDTNEYENGIKQLKYNEKSFIDKLKGIVKGE